MNHNGTEEFNLILNYLGHGDVKNALWVIGVEPGGDDWKNNEETKAAIKEDMSCAILKFPTFEYRHELSYLYQTQVGNATAKIANSLSEKCEDWKTYRDKYLWADGSAVFNGNLLPVSKKDLSSKWWLNNDYAGLLGLTYEQYATSRQDILAHRKAMFDKLAVENKPQAIICFGMSDWSVYEKFFVINTAEPDRTIESTLVFEADRVILTRHFSNGMKDEILSQISSRLKEWGVVLP